MKLRWFILGSIAAAILQTAALGKIIYDRAELIRNGKEVVLESGMVDPRDLFRGHYVTLNLTIGRIDMKDVETVGEFTSGEDVYVTLAKSEDGFWLPQKIYAELPETNTPFIKGKLLATPGQNETTGTYRIDFSIERFYAEETRAKDLEKVRNDRNLGVVVALGNDGSAVIKGISVEGELIYDEPVF